MEIFGVQFKLFVEEIDNFWVLSIFLSGLEKTK